MRFRATAAFTVMEVTIAMTLLIAGLTVVGQLLLTVRRLERESDQRHIAMVEAANVLEQLLALSPEQLSPQSIEQFALSEHARRILPQAELAVTLGDVTADPLPARQVAVQIQWQSSRSHTVEPVRLTTWLYPPEETP